MGDYIKVPVPFEQLEDINFIIDMADRLDLGITYFAGSAALGIFLNKPSRFSNDIDFWVQNKKDLDVLRRELSDRGFYGYRSKHAVNLQGAPFDINIPLQIIPVKPTSIEGLLDTFDLTASAIGIDLSSDSLEYVVHKDIYAQYLGIAGPYKFRPRAGSLHMFHRANKYAKKFNRPVEKMFPQFTAFALKYRMQHRIKKYSGNQFIAVLKNYEMRSENMANYEDNELLAYLLEDDDDSPVRPSVSFGSPASAFSGRLQMGDDAYISAGDMATLRGGGFTSAGAVYNGLDTTIEPGFTPADPVDMTEFHRVVSRMARVHDADAPEDDDEDVPIFWDD